MATSSPSSEKADILVFGPPKPIVTKGLVDGFALHAYENQRDLGRIATAASERIRGIAVTDLVHVDAAMMSKFPKLEIVSTFGVGYDHIDVSYARDHKIVVTHTPDVLTEETADAALGLLICTVREFVKADRYARSGLWANQPYPLTAGSMRDRAVGIVGMGRIGRAIARRLEAMKVPVVYHSRRPAENVLYRHYPKLLDMAKAVDTLVVMTPGGAATSKLINAEVIGALGPNGVIINMSRGSVVDEEALIAALKKGEILAAGLDVFANEPVVPDELRAMQNVVLLPHMGSASVVTRGAMERLVVENINDWFAGKIPPTPVPETPVKSR
jgi:lactate dehydrogenase-like 2-hydroxyacid dehydrogenase